MLGQLNSVAAILIAAIATPAMPATQPGCVRQVETGHSSVDFNCALVPRCCPVIAAID
jgi:hypothetical protein